jgi:hypothetical protein
MVPRPTRSPAFSRGTCTHSMRRSPSSHVESVNTIRCALSALMIRNSRIRSGLQSGRGMTESARWRSYVIAIRYRSVLSPRRCIRPILTLRTCSFPGPGARLHASPGNPEDDAYRMRILGSTSAASLDTKFILTVVCLGREEAVTPRYVARGSPEIL